MGDAAPNGHQNGVSADKLTDTAPQLSTTAPIAIVGMSCRFGGDATSPSKLWDLCAEGKDSWTPIPLERFDAAGLYDERKGKLGRHFVQGGYFLKDIASFDSAFFSYTTDVANAMDPQIRMLLESVYESVEDAGIPIERLSGSKTSVFAGSFNTDYSDMTIRDPETIQPAYKTGNGIAMLSNRISHFYNFQGPSVTIDVGCSTGLVALHQACHSLRSGESDVAIIGSSLVCLSPDVFIAMTKAGVLGPTGKCFAWDERAEGYGRGEGVASLVLKPLDHALRDGNTVHAVVRETGVNQDGKTSTITSPSMAAQVKLIQEVYRRAGLDPGETGYVEAHMTGTPTGDPIEAEALARTFGACRTAQDSVLVGSVKPNIGHTEPVSGLAAIIKTAYTLKLGLIAPNVNYEKTNPNIPLDKWRLKARSFVPTTLLPWPSDKARRASVSNFGYGGVNAHVIMEAAPEQREVASVRSSSGGHRNGEEEAHPASLVYIVSAKDAVAAQKMNQNLARHIREAAMLGTAPPSPIDLAFTLAECRSRFPWRTAVHAQSLAELADLLDDPSRKVSRAGRKPRLGFVFNGQGAQWHAMGRELIQTYSVFRRSLLAADQILRDYGASWSLHEELLRDEKTTRVNEICLSQPISVALQLCLVDLLSSWGVTPSAVTSHSSGEIAAAYAVGALTFQQALGVVYFRGVLAQKHHERSGVAGGMLAAGIGADGAAEYIRDTAQGTVVVACHNSPESVTISGDLPAIEEVAARLSDNNIFGRKLNVPLAYHSHHMAAMAQDYTDKLREILTPAPRTWRGALFASPVTGDVINSPKALTPEHFVRNLVSPVLFSQAFEQMCFGSAAASDKKIPSPTEQQQQQANVDVIIEIGAHGTLAGPIRQILKQRRIPYISCLKRGSDAMQTMQEAVCALLAHGCPVSLVAVNGHGAGTYLQGLPSYAWNHKTPHWIESRLYREHRYKRFPPHELLGSPVSGSNWQTPTWRNFLRQADIEWLTDHKLGADTVFPGAGYVAMAIEAVRLVTDPTEEAIAGYRLRGVDIISALVIPDTAMGVEIQLVLRPCSEKELEHKGWFEFEVWSVSATDNSSSSSSSSSSSPSWVQHCKGSITAERTSKTGETVTRFVPPAPRADSFFLASSEPVQEVEPERVFLGLRAMNLFHGPVFQNLIRSRRGAGPAPQSVTTLGISPVAAQGRPDYVLHPTTLDSLIQAAYVSIPQSTQVQSMVVPRNIRHLYVPRQLQRQAGDKITVFVNLLKADRRGAEVTAAAVNGEGDDDDNNADTPQLLLEGLYCQAVPLESDGSSESQPSAICSQTRWEVDVTAGGVPAAFKKVIQAPVDEEDVDFEKKLDRVSFNLIQDALSQLSPAEDQHSWPAHLQRLYAWMQSVVVRGQAGKLGPGSRNWFKSNAGLRQRLADDVAAENAAGRLLVRVGQHLADIVRSQVEPGALLQRDSLLEEYYEELPRLRKRSYIHLQRIVAQYAVKTPGARVLEIGRHSGAATARMLDAFAARAEEGSTGTLLGHYDLSDIAEDQFEVVKQNCTPWEALIGFKTLDIQSDTGTKDLGSTAHSYDLIAVVDSLQGAVDPSKILKNIHDLLKPGGKLVLVENTRTRLDTQLVFGVLPGWWRHAEHEESPILAVDGWDELLKKSGFSGVDLEVGDCEDAQFQATSVLLTTAVADFSTPLPPTIPPAFPTAVSVVYADDSPPAEEWLCALKTDVATKVGPAVVTIEPLSNVHAQPETTYILTPEMAAPFLHDIEYEPFSKLKELLTQGQGLLWLSRSSIITASNPLFSQSVGLLRTAKQEDTTKRYIYLDFEATTEDPWSVATIPHITHVLRHSFDASRDNAAIEWEYAVKDGMLHVPRVYPNTVEDRVSGLTHHDPAPVEQALWQPGRPLVWETVQTAGTLSGLYFTDDNLAREPDLPHGKVEIETRAMGVNFRDIMVALGQIDETRHIHDAAGIVTRLGPGTEASGLKVGDRVCGVLDGRFATHPRAPWTSLARIPDDGISWEEAASLPMVFLTSYICLFDLARLKPGERVLIHAGSGGVGQSAIMLAQHAGAEVFVTCSSEAKRELVMTQYGLEADHILSSRDASFAAAILARTGGVGVDVVINSLSGPLLKATWECMARFGRFVEIGKVDIEAARRLDLTPLTRSAMICGFDLTQHCAFDGPAVHRAWQALLSLWAEGAIRAVHPIVTYPIADMELAMRRMQRGAHIGKLVLVPGQEAQVKVLTRCTSLTADLSDPDSTYLIVGGLGGIGHALAEWMLRRGARHILVVSRSAESHPEAASLVARGLAQGCRVVVRNCNVARESELVQLLADCAQDGLPPVRGVIQAAMALHDTVLERLTFEQWQGGIQPKVDGTLHLHHHLPDLRFFVMLSSLTGVIGHTSQANYAAGNTFQDALARHRTAQGLPAVSIDLGAVGDVGVVAASGDSMRDRVERTLGAKSIPIGRVLELIEGAVCRPLRDDPNTSQVITGIAEYDKIPEGTPVKQDRRFATLRLASAVGAMTAGAPGVTAAKRSPDEVLRQSLAETAPSSPEARTLVAGALTHKLGSLFNLAPADIDTSASLSAVGVDSLVAVELRNWLSSVVQAKVTVFEILQTATIREFAELVVGRRL
ncbi:hypothetical protein M406DRAFT_245011 [Cryphonectria parasitica EP155]|uniref:Carrier domain-containing protein n=1 Tax=Cryphonectria parasitica (strain ATCC 38755 / EP155) TaxID=660469 RepID=A0A9P4Y9G9_CRYP1|nr:uncharacterized protein M406DRAFT_245011 [Cryphonectria parasitica EP155]KAF3769432.1 hypothetical protein M406DRAFT_245011 [Cryphonectria parasitica EP155]